MNAWTKVALATLGALALVACQTERNDRPREEGPPPARDDGRVAQLQGQVAERDRTIARLEARIRELESARPAVRAAGGAVSVGIQAPRDTYPGEPIPYRVQVTNQGEAPAVDVEVWVELPEGLEPVETGGGEWDASRRTLRWGFASVPGRRQEELGFTARAAGTGAFETCVQLRHRLTACATTDAFQPAIACQISAGEVQLRGQAFPVLIAVTNTGSGVARGVAGDLRATENLTIQGPPRIDFGNIPAGQRVEKQIQVVGTADAPYQLEMQVKGAPGLETTCGVEGAIVSADVEIAKSGDRARFEGQDISYKIHVESTGTTTARNVVVVDPIPPGAKFVRAGQDGQLVGNAVQWNLGDLEPGQGVDLDLVLVGEVQGTLRNCARVRAVGVPEKEACAETQVIYAPAMQIVTQDTEDPIEVGGETVYVIQITNEGRKDTTQVVLEVDIPQEGDFVAIESSPLPGRFDREAHRVVFDPIPVMRPGQDVVYRIRVKFHTAGSAVCGGTMRFAEFSKPIRSEEGTNIFE